MIHNHPLFILGGAPQAHVDYAVKAASFALPLVNRCYQ